MICLSAPREVRFDCGHACCCAACSEELLAQQGHPNLGLRGYTVYPLTRTELPRRDQPNPNPNPSPNPHPNPHPHHEAAALTVALTVTLTVTLTPTPTLTLTARRALPELPRTDQHRPQRARRGGLTLTLA